MEAHHPLVQWDKQLLTCSALISVWPSQLACRLYSLVGGDENDLLKIESCRELSAMFKSKKHLSQAGFTVHLPQARLANLH